MASVTWPPLVTAAPISSSVKVARARPGTAAARRPMRVARTDGTGTAVVDIGRSRRGGWRGRAPQHPPQPVAPTIARTAPATPPRSRARARPCKLQPIVTFAPYCGRSGRRWASIGKREDAQRSGGIGLPGGDDGVLLGAGIENRVVD